MAPRRDGALVNGIVKVNPQLVEEAMTMSQIATDTILNSYEPNHPQELLLNKKIIIRRNF